MSHKFPLDLINQANFPDFNYIPYASHEQTPFLINHIFLNKKRLPSEKSLFEHRANNTKEISDAINEVFNKDNELEEEKESTYDKSIELNKKKPFKTIKLEAPGRKSKKLNKKNFSNKKTHDKYSQDNIITKIQVHYINFLTNYIIHKTITNFGLKRDKFKNFHQLKLDSLYNDNITKEEKIKHLTLDNFYKKEPIDKNKMMAKIFTNDFNIGRQINMNFGHFYYQDYTKNETQENTKITNTNEKNKIIETNLNKETQVTKETKETEESLYVKTIDEKIKKNNLSFISKALDNENIFKKNPNKKIKQMKYIKNNFFKEKKLLKGFETEERKGPILLIKSLKPKLKTNGELFDENMKLLKRTNPIAFQLQEKKDEFDLKQLRKKVNMLKINEGNVMKGKKLIINKDENKDE